MPPDDAKSYGTRIRWGLCPFCGDPRELASVLCPRCGARGRRALLRRVARLRAQGLCTVCGEEPLDPGNRTRGPACKAARRKT